MESKTNWLLIVITLLLLVAGVLFFLTARIEAEVKMVEAQVIRAESAEMHQMVIEEQQAELKAALEKKGKAIRRR